MSEVRGISLVGSWKPEEVAALPSILSPFPSKWLERNPFVSKLVRGKVLTDAPPGAPGHSKYDPNNRSIVVFDKGVYHDGSIDPEQFRRSIYHELAHSILRIYPGLLAKWTPATSGDGHVDEYAKTSPEEDFADTFSEFFIQNKKTRSVVPKKAKFLQELLARSKDGEEKIAMFNISSFTDELVKLSAAPSATALKAILAKVIKHPGTKGLGLVGAGAAGGGVIGHGKGEEGGLAQGRKDVRRVAVQARGIGRREGVMMYHQALQKSLRQKNRQDPYGRR